MEPTTTLRFPDRLHSRAKIAATERGVSLQDYVGQAVEAVLDGKGKRVPVSPLASKVEALTEYHRGLVERFVAMLAVAPDFQLRAIDQYISASVRMFRQVDKKHFDRDGG